MEKLKTFVSKKFIVLLLVFFWLPFIVMKMVEKQVSENILILVVGGMFAAAGIYKVVQGQIDRIQK